MLSVSGFALMVAFALSQAGPPAASQPGATTATGFLDKTLALDGETYAYCVYVPPDYTPERAWPVILFLHGSGERGKDGFLQTDVGIARAIRRHREWFPAIVVMPQCRPNRTWFGPEGPGPMAMMALKCVEAASREYHLDRDRMYLTGLSLGGQGTWMIAAAFPGQFAAIVPICGFLELGPTATPGLTEKVAAQLVNENIWCFHGDADQAVPVAASRALIAAIRAAGGNPRYTEYPGVGHNAWDAAYDTADLWRWLHAQRRAAPAPVEQRPASPAGEQ